MTYHKRFTPEQVALWLKVKAAILARPELYDQDIPETPSESMCGSPGCVLGWAYLFAIGPRTKGGITDRTADLEIALGLDEHEQRNVFYSCWLREANEALYAATSKVEEAAACAMEIDHILTTGSVQ